MRNLTLIIIAFSLAFAGYAQKKPKINKAISAWEDGELVEAKSIIDRAIVHEKTKDDGKTWYYRGLIYATLDTTSNEQFSSLSDNPMEESINAFAMADSLGEEGKDYFISNAMGLPVTKTQQIDGYYGYYYNKAVTEFQESEFESAVADFKNAYYIIPDDTNAYINAAFAAHNGQLWDAAKKHYRLALDKGATSTDLYNNYANILSAVDKDNETALGVINEALVTYPTDIDLMKSRIQTLINLDRISEAKDDLIEAVEAEPDNPTLFFTLGLIYEQLDSADLAKDAYKSAMEVDPDHYEANFNYGVMLIDEANSIITERNNLGISKADQQKSKALGPKIDAKLEEAMPQWEKVLEIRPDDQGAIETLAYIYTQLGMDDKAQEMESKMED